MSARRDQMSVTAKVRRVARLGSLPAGSVYLAAAGAVRRLRGERPADVKRDLRKRSASRTKRILGEAKGGALKAGQLLSTVDSLFPADPDATWQRALAALPADNPAVPFAELEPTLVADLGSDWRARFLTFDEQAEAAASIGQVYRGTWEDGRGVAVKIQYPHIADALRVDLAAISFFTRVAAFMAPGMALPPLVAEMRDRLTEELDYRREAAVQQAFVDAYAGDAGTAGNVVGGQRVLIPDVILATRRVLVTEWLEGIPFTRLAATGNESPDQGTRNQAGLAYMRFLISGPERAGWLHTDPHPGNFRWVDSGAGPGSLGVLDFGSALRMPSGMPGAFGNLIRLLQADDLDEIRTGLLRDGFIKPGSDVDAGKLRDYLSPFTEPSRHQTFAFSPEWLQSQFGRLGDPRNPDFAVALQLRMPPEHLFTHRVWLGIVGVLCQLRAEIPVRDEVRRWLPGLVETVEE